MLSGADPNLEDEDLQTPLHYAVTEGHASVAEVISCQLELIELRKGWWTQKICL